jgi:hypothetical protein
MRIPDLKLLGNGVKEKYDRGYADCTNLVLLDPDIVGALPSAKDVNDTRHVLVTVAAQARRNWSPQQQATAGRVQAAQRMMVTRS